MTTAIAEPPPAPDVDQDVEEAAAVTVPPYTKHIKPKGITEKTWEKLSPLQRRFTVEYINGGNTVTAYQNAGYSAKGEDKDKARLRNNAYAVCKGKKVQAALLEYADRRAALEQAKADFALDWIVSEHERLMGLAETKGDLAVATRNLELIGRTRGVYADVVVGDVVARREYTEWEKAEALRLSSLLLEKGDHRGAIVGNPTQDQAVSQGGEMRPADTGSKAAPGKVDTRADRTGAGESEGLSLTPAGAEAVVEPPAGYCGPDTVAEPGKKEE